MLEAAGKTPDTDGRARRWDAHNTRRRADFLDAALVTIEEHGPNVGVKQIAEHVGLPRPVLYRHFRDRHDLDEQIREAIVERLMAELVPTLTTEDTPRATIRNAVWTYLGWIERHPRLHQFLATGSSRTPEPSSRVIAGTKTAIAGHVAKLFADVLDSLDLRTDIAEPLAFAVIGLVDATVNRRLSAGIPDWDWSELADFLSSSIWHVIDGHLSGLGVHVDQDVRIGDLRS